MPSRQRPAPFPSLHSLLPPLLTLSTACSGQERSLLPTGSLCFPWLSGEEVLEIKQASALRHRNYSLQPLQYADTLSKIRSYHLAFTISMVILKSIKLIWILLDKNPYRFVSIVKTLLIFTKPMQTFKAARGIQGKR